MRINPAHRLPVTAAANPKNAAAKKGVNCAAKNPLSGIGCPGTIALNHRTYPGASSATCAANSTGTSNSHQRDVSFDSIPKPILCLAI